MTIKKLAIGVGIALAVLIAAVWWLFFWGDTPEAVDVEAANTQLDVDLAVATDDAPALPRPVRRRHQRHVGGRRRDRRIRF